MNGVEKIKELVADRREALLSMDKEKILAYMRKYGVPLPSNDDVFWISVHKARTADLSLPDDERQISREWLAARGYQAMG